MPRNIDSPCKTLAGWLCQGRPVSRVAGVLLGWGRAACGGKTEMRFNMAVSHTELASFAGTSRETLTRTLGKLRKDKANVSGKRI